MRTPVPHVTGRAWWSVIMGVTLLVVAAMPAWSVVYLNGPAVLDRNGETYVVNQNFSCAGTALVIGAANVVLDLGGHTITYGTAGAQAFGVYIAPDWDSGTGKAGVNCEVKNGTLTQAASNGASRCYGVYSRYVAHTAGPIIHDLTVNTHSGVSEGIRLIGSGLGMQVYGNVLNTSNIVENIDEGCAAIHLADGDFGTATTPAVIRSNTINGSQTGIWLDHTKWAQIYENQIHHTAPAVNAKASYAVRTLAIEHCLIHHNHISTPRGMGIVLQYGSNYNQVYSNDLDLSEDQPGEWNRVYGLRLRHGGNYNKLYDNTVIVRSVVNNELMAFRMGDGPDEDASAGQPTYNEIYNNTFDCRYNGDMNINRLCMSIARTGAGNVVRNNIIKSNVYVFQACEPIVGSTELRSNRFVKGDNPNPGFETINLWGGTGPHTLLDTTGSNGASLQSVHYGSPAGTLYVSWYLQVLVQDQSSQPLSGATVEIRDRNSALVFSGLTAADGTVRPAVQQYTEANTGDVNFTPHTVTATKTGYSTASTTVTVDASKQVVLSLAGGAGGITLRKQASPTSTVPSGIITYTITYSNDTGGTIKNVVITDKIAAATTYVAGSAKHNGQPITPDPYQSGSLVISLGSLAAGASGTIEFQVRVD